MYCEVFWYVDEDHNEWSSQGFRTIKDAKEFIKKYSNIFYGMELTKNEIQHYKSYRRH